MKRSSDKDESDDAGNKKREIQREVGEDLLYWLPRDIMDGHIATALSAASMLVMSMTSKQNNDIFKNLFNQLIICKPGR